MPMQAFLSILYRFENQLASIDLMLVSLVWADTVS